MLGAIMKGLLAGAIVMGLAVSVCQAQTFGSSRELLHLEWELASGERPAISGYVYNQHDFWAVDIQLLVQGLDSAGRLRSRIVGYVDRDVPPGGRAYFEVPLPRREAKYRVTLLAFDWAIQSQ